VRCEPMQSHGNIVDAPGNVPQHQVSTPTQPPASDRSKKQKKKRNRGPAYAAVNNARFTATRQARQLATEFLASDWTWLQVVPLMACVKLNLNKLSSYSWQYTSISLCCGCIMLSLMTWHHGGDTVATWLGKIGVASPPLHPLRASICVYISI